MTEVKPKVEGERLRRLQVAIDSLNADRGREDAWTSLINVARPLVYATAFRHLHGMRELAEDVTQEIFLRLFLDDEFPQKIESATHCAAFLRASSRNAAIDAWRRLSREALETTTDELLMMPSADQTDSALLQQEAIREFRTLFSDSSEIDRKLVELLIQQTPRAAIAEALGQSYSAVTVRLHRLRQRLRTSAKEQMIKDLTLAD